ncbi:MAG: hypothetical protein LEGION0398_MBIBDBAK_00773 [Legionellaceae bacterium]
MSQKGPQKWRHYRKEESNVFSESLVEKIPTNFVITDSVVFDVTDIASFDFEMHQKFYRQLKIKYPDLANKLYQHNPELKTL